MPSSTLKTKHLVTVEYMFGRKEKNLEALEARVSALERRLAEQDQIIAQLGNVSSVPASLLPKRSTLHPEVTALIQQGNDIAAIKRYRELTGAGLLQAKNTIDAEKDRRKL